MCYFRMLNFNLSTSLLLLFVALLYGTKSSAVLECSIVYAESHTVVLSSNSTTQQFGLKPLNIQLYSYTQSQNQSSSLQRMTLSDTETVGALYTDVRGIHFNGHKGTLGLIALLFPFHGFT